METIKSAIAACSQSNSSDICDERNEKQHSGNSPATTEMRVYGQEQVNMSLPPACSHLAHEEVQPQLPRMPTSLCLFNPIQQHNQSTDSAEQDIQSDKLQCNKTSQPENVNNYSEDTTKTVSVRDLHNQVPQPSSRDAEMPSQSRSSRQQSDMETRTTNSSSDIQTMNGGCNASGVVMSAVDGDHCNDSHLEMERPDNLRQKGECIFPVAQQQSQEQTEKEKELDSPEMSCVLYTVSSCAESQVAHIGHTMGSDSNTHGMIVDTTSPGSSHSVCYDDCQQRVCLDLRGVDMRDCLLVGWHSQRECGHEVVCISNDDCQENVTEMEKIEWDLPDVECIELCEGTHYVERAVSPMETEEEHVWKELVVGEGNKDGVKASGGLESVRQKNEMQREGKDERQEDEEQRQAAGGEERERNKTQGVERVGGIDVLVEGGEQGNERQQDDRQGDEKQRQTADGQEREGGEAQEVENKGEKDEVVEGERQEDEGQQDDRQEDEKQRQTANGQEREGGEAQEVAHKGEKDEVVEGERQTDDRQQDEGQQDEQQRDERLCSRQMLELIDGGMRCEPSTNSMHNMARNVLLESTQPPPKESSDIASSKEQVLDVEMVDEFQPSLAYQLVKANDCATGECVDGYGLNSPCPIVLDDGIDTNHVSAILNNNHNSHEFEDCCVPVSGGHTLVESQQMATVFAAAAVEQFHHVLSICEIVRERQDSSAGEVVSSMGNDTHIHAVCVAGNHSEIISLAADNDKEMKRVVDGQDDVFVVKEGTECINPVAVSEKEAPHSCVNNGELIASGTKEGCDSSGCDNVVLSDQLTDVTTGDNGNTNIDINGDDMAHDCVKVGLDVSVCLSPIMTAGESPGYTNTMALPHLGDSPCDGHVSIGQLSGDLVNASCFESSDTISISQIEQQSLLQRPPSTSHAPTSLFSIGHTIRSHKATSKTATGNGQTREGIEVIRQSETETKESKVLKEESEMGNECSVRVETCIVARPSTGSESCAHSESWLGEDCVTISDHQLNGTTDSDNTCTSYVVTDDSCSNQQSLHEHCEGQNRDNVDGNVCHTYQQPNISSPGVLTHQQSDGEVCPMLHTTYGLSDYLGTMECPSHDSTSFDLHNKSKLLHGSHSNYTVSKEVGEVTTYCAIPCQCDSHIEQAEALIQERQMKEKDQLVPSGQTAMEQMTGVANTSVDCDDVTQEKSRETERYGLLSEEEDTQDVDMVWPDIENVEAYQSQAKRLKSDNIEREEAIESNECHSTQFMSTRQPTSCFPQVTRRMKSVTNNRPRLRLGLSKRQKCRSLHMFGVTDSMY